jgi:hypothetical protein
MPYLSEKHRGNLEAGLDVIKKIEADYFQDLCKFGKGPVIIELF